ncbi:MAG TPA: IPT/TIG domain-containing protein, partial [Nitrospira sp.]|nr:IPT/TIG domain-containing protein [Nitrospira sp.]
MTLLRVIIAAAAFGALLPNPSYAGQSAIEVTPTTATPGATVVLSGKGLGSFKSVQFNKVTFAGLPALIQRWESDLVEVKVPVKATTGPVEVFVGKKKLAAGTFTVVAP